jgi:hypothetical protein
MEELLTGQIGICGVSVRPNGAIFISIWGWCRISCVNFKKLQKRALFL